MNQERFIEDNFYQIVLELFLEAGHIDSSTPEFKNHSSEQFVYLDNKTEISLNDYQRSLLQFFNNVSRLFTVQNCVFISLNLTTLKRNRSQIAHDIHEILQSVVDSEGSICIFHFEEEVMFSFMGFGFGCFLSDWYPINDDYGELLRRLDISNMSIDSDFNYFTDMIYSLAREYYFSFIPIRSDAIPKYFFIELDTPELANYEIDEFIENEKKKPFLKYDSDYVEYQEFKKNDIESDFDMLILEMELGQQEDTDLMEKTNFEESNQAVKSEYEFKDIDPKVFDDPSLLLKFIEESDN